MKNLLTLILLATFAASTINAQTNTPTTPAPQPMPSVNIPAFPSIPTGITPVNWNAQPKVLAFATTSGELRWSDPVSPYIGGLIGRFSGVAKSVSVSQNGATTYYVVATEGNGTYTFADYNGDGISDYRVFSPTPHIGTAATQTDDYGNPFTLIFADYNTRFGRSTLGWNGGTTVTVDIAGDDEDAVKMPRGAESMVVMGNTLYYLDNFWDGTTGNRRIWNVPMEDGSPNWGTRKIYIHLPNLTGVAAGNGSLLVTQQAGNDYVNILRVNRGLFSDAATGLSQVATVFRPSAPAAMVESDGYLYVPVNAFGPNGDWIGGGIMAYPTYTPTLSAPATPSVAVVVPGMIGGSSITAVTTMSNRPTGGAVGMPVPRW